MIHDQEWLDHPKVKQARQLMREAHLELQAERREAANGLLCSCGHRHDQHTPIHNINYSAGVCHECDCMHFLSPPTKPEDTMPGDTSSNVRGGVNIDLDNLFIYHAPKGDQTERYVKIRDAGKVMAQVILDCCPPNADTSAAIRKVREAVMTANAAIACGE